MKVFLWSWFLIFVAVSSIAFASTDDMPLPPWLNKMIIVQTHAKDPDRIEECVYDGKRAFLVTHTDRFDTGDEHVLLSEEGKEICQFGGYVWRVTSGACDITKIQHKRTVLIQNRPAARGVAGRP
jgi:hypothetical protein